MLRRTTTRSLRRGPAQKADLEEKAKVKEEAIGSLGVDINLAIGTWARAKAKVMIMEEAKVMMLGKAKAMVVGKAKDGMTKAKVDEAKVGEPPRGAKGYRNNGATTWGGEPRWGSAAYPKRLWEAWAKQVVEEGSS